MKMLKFTINTSVKKITLLLLGSVLLFIPTSCFVIKEKTSNLPLVLIDTFEKRIPDEPKISARMKIIYDEYGGRNALNSSHVHFDGKVGIEVRGKSSQKFPKKQYGFETQDGSGNDQDVSLLQLPAESDWILNGPYSDKTLMRNYLAYEFSNRMGRYASRAKFVEVFLNDSGDTKIKQKHYVGVYLLMEKIKRGKNRVNIQSLKSTQEKPSEITGGYILKIDKIDINDSYFLTGYRTRLIHVYPKGNKISDAQKAWIRNYMSAFESSLKAPDLGEYVKYIHTDTFIDYFIINELFRNIDGFRNSTYMYKDRNTKLKMGPIWDFNLSMGNASFNNGWETDGWLIDTNPVPFWWDQLLMDENFKQKLVKRWRALRKGELATSKLMEEIDRTAKNLSEAQSRNFERWPVLGVSVLGNPESNPPTYEQEVHQLKTWLQDRLKWIDAHIGSHG